MDKILWLAYPSQGLLSPLVTLIFSPKQNSQVDRSFHKIIAFSISPVWYERPWLLPFPGWFSLKSALWVVRWSLTLPWELCLSSFLAKKILKIVECPRHSWGCHFLPFSFINGLIPFDSPVLLRGTWEGLFIAFGRLYLSPPPHPNAYLLPASRANLWVSPPLGFPLQLLFSLGFLDTSTAVCGIVSSPGHLTTRPRTLR